MNDADITKNLKVIGRGKFTTCYKKNYKTVISKIY